MNNERLADVIEEYFGAPHSLGEPGAFSRLQKAKTELMCAAHELRAASEKEKENKPNAG